MKLSRPLQILGITLCLAATTLLISCKPESTGARLNSPALECAITPNGSINGGVCAGKPVTITLSITGSMPLIESNFEMAHDNDRLIRMVKVGDQIGIFAADLTNQAIRPIGSIPFSVGVSGLAVSGDHVIWGAARTIHVYNLRTSKESQIQTIATDPVPTVSGNTVVWDGLYAYDLKSQSPFTITSKAGATRYPLISGNWVVALDTIYDGPEWGHGAKLYAHNLKTNEEFQIGEMAMGYGWRTFYALDAPWVAWLSKPTDPQAGEQPSLHLFNLDTQAERIINPTITMTNTRSFPLNLQLDGGVLLYSLNRQLFGYDIGRDSSFPIAKPSTAVGNPIISNDRIIWETPSDKSYFLTIEQVIRGAVPPGGTAQSPLATPSGAVGASTSPLATPTQTR
jgi:hypothetical protein